MIKSTCLSQQGPLFQVFISRRRNKEVRVMIIFIILRQLYVFYYKHKVVRYIFVNFDLNFITLSVEISSVEIFVGKTFCRRILFADNFLSIRYRNNVRVLEINSRNTVKHQKKWTNYRISFSFYRVFCHKIGQKAKFVNQSVQFQAKNEQSNLKPSCKNIRQQNLRR